MPQLSDGFLWEILLSNDALTELFMYSVIDVSLTHSANSLNYVILVT